MKPEELPACTVHLRVPGGWGTGFGVGPGLVLTLIYEEVEFPPNPTPEDSQPEP